MTVCWYIFAHRYLYWDILTTYHAAWHLTKLALFTCLASSLPFPPPPPFKIYTPSRKAFFFFALFPQA